MASVDIPDYLVWFIWTFINLAPPVRRTTVEDIESDAQLEELMEDSYLTFVDGLEDVFRSPTPPTIDYFKSLPSTVVETVWGIYVIVLEKPGHRARIYIGSGTHTASGVAARWSQYDNRVNLPRFVEQALEEGFTITHKGLFCWSPVPRNDSRLRVRNLYLIIECTFSLAFWAMKSKTDDYNMPSICPWSLEALEYDGCCSHACHHEGLRDSMANSLTDEQLETYYEEMNLRRAEANKLRLRAFKRDNFEAWKISKAQSYANQKIVRANNIATRKYPCDPCGVACPSQWHLDAHRKTQTHLDKVNGVVHTPKVFYCEVCHHEYPGQSHLDIHLDSQKHKDNAAVAASYAASFGESPITDVTDDLQAQICNEPSMDLSRQLIIAAGLVTDDPKESARLIRRQKAAANVAAKKYNCELCIAPFGSQTELNVHFTTQKHIDNAALAATVDLPMDELHAFIEQRKVEQRRSKNKAADKKRCADAIAAKKFYCRICDYAAGKQKSLNQHYKTNKHLDNAAMHESGESEISMDDAL